tara:strand:- start:313 stop:471 length:159 start_codon:yes stop_codon:yes gene_type:complete
MGLMIFFPSVMQAILPLERAILQLSGGHGAALAQAMLSTYIKEPLIHSNIIT